MRSRGWPFISWLVLLSLLFSACAPDVPVGATEAAPLADSSSAAETQPNRSIYTEEKCDFEGSEFVDQGVRCGVIQVPEDREEPDSAMLELHVVVLKSTGQEPLSDPIFITFGPYSTGFMYFLGFTRLWGRFLESRDIIALEPRGSGRSGISLECPELDTAYLSTLELEYNSRAAQDILLEAHQTCRKRGETLVSDIGNLNIVEMAADLEDLRQAMGLEKVNVQGIGTGSRIAEVWAQNHPDSIRTVTMISPIPLADNLYADQARSLDRSISAVFQDCAADKNCSKAYPNLDKVFAQLVDDLNAHPLNVDVNYITDGTQYAIRLNGDRLIDLAYVIAASTDPDWISYLPQILFETKVGNTAPAAEALSRYIDYTRPFGTPFAQGIFCDEILSQAGKDAAQAEVDRAPSLYNAYLKNGLAFNSSICTVWGERVNRPEIPKSSNSVVPALFISSNTDVVSTAELSASLNPLFDPAFVFDFSGGGGTTSLKWWDCWSQVENAFMDDPKIPPQVSCTQQKQTISWITFKP